MAYKAFVQNVHSKTAGATHHILFQIKQALSVAKAQKVLLNWFEIINLMPEQQSGRVLTISCKFT